MPVVAGHFVIFVQKKEDTFDGLTQNRHLGRVFNLLKETSIRKVEPGALEKIEIGQRRQLKLL